MDFSFAWAASQQGFVPTSPLALLQAPAVGAHGIGAQDSVAPASLPDIIALVPDPIIPLADEPAAIPAPAPGGTAPAALPIPPLPAPLGPPVILSQHEISMLISLPERLVLPDDPTKLLAGLPVMVLPPEPVPSIPAFPWLGLDLPAVPVPPPPPLLPDWML